MVILAFTVAICVQLPPAVGARSIRKLSSLSLLSVQIRLIWLVEAGVALKSVGAMMEAFDDHNVTASNTGVVVSIDEER